MATGITTRSGVVPPQELTLAVVVIRVGLAVEDTREASAAVTAAVDITKRGR